MFKAFCKFISDAIEGGSSVEVDVVSLDGVDCKGKVACGFSELLSDKVFRHFGVLGTVSKEEEGECFAEAFCFCRNGDVAVAEENIQRGVYHSWRSVLQLLFKCGVQIAVDEVSLFDLGFFGEEFHRVAVAVVGAESGCGLAL